MNLSLKTVIYDIDGVLKEMVSFENYNELGFEFHEFNNSCNDLLIYHYQNKVDVLVINAKGIDRERLIVVLEIIYNNFCKNILLIGEYDLHDNRFSFLDLTDGANMDLRIGMKLLEIKRRINSKPSHNVALIKSKINEVLNRYKFSMKHSGFKYFAEAILKAYLCFPYEYSTMNLYKEIADEHGKSMGAVEKSMRTALFRALNKINVMPQTEEKLKLRAELPPGLTNNMAISAIVGRLLSDKDLCDQEEMSIGVK